MSTQVGLHPGLADAERLLDGVVIAAVCVEEKSVVVSWCIWTNRVCWWTHSTLTSGGALYFSVSLSQTGAVQHHPALVLLLPSLPNSIWWWCTVVIAMLSCTENRDVFLRFAISQKCGEGVEVRQSWKKNHVVSSKIIWKCKHYTSGRKGYSSYLTDSNLAEITPCEHFCYIQSCTTTCRSTFVIFKINQA